MKIPIKDILKAIKRGSREAALEDKTGFVSPHKIHRSKKIYFRKNKEWKRNDLP